MSTWRSRGECNIIFHATPRGVHATPRPAFSRRKYEQLTRVLGRGRRLTRAPAPVDLHPLLVFVVFRAHAADTCRSVSRIEEGAFSMCSSLASVLLHKDDNCTNSTGCDAKRDISAAAFPSCFGFGLATLNSSLPAYVHFDVCMHVLCFSVREGATPLPPQHPPEEADRHTCTCAHN